MMWEDPAICVASLCPGKRGSLLRLSTHPPSPGHSLGNSGNRTRGDQVRARSYKWVRKAKGRWWVVRTGLVYNVLPVLGMAGGQHGDVCTWIWRTNVSYDMEERWRTCPQSRATQKLPQGRSWILFTACDQEGSKCNSPVIAVYVDLI